MGDCCGDKFGKPMTKLAKDTKFILVHRGQDGYVESYSKLKFYGIDSATDYVEFEEVSKLTENEFREETKTTDRLNFTILAKSWTI